MWITQAFERRLIACISRQWPCMKKWLGPLLKAKNVFLSIPVLLSDGHMHNYFPRQSYCLFCLWTAQVKANGWMNGGVTFYWLARVAVGCEAGFSVLRFSWIHWAPPDPFCIAVCFTKPYILSGWWKRSNAEPLLLPGRSWKIQAYSGGC